MGEYETTKKDALEKAKEAKPEEEKIDKKTGKPIPKKEKGPDEVLKDAALKAYSASVSLLNTLVGYVQKAIKGSIMKYRVEIMGIVAALTGNPSTPWHITIGNPLRPVFCSGDMLVDETTIKLGPTLAFNDLPSTITVEFTVTNARPWGMQEIMAKFNSGYLRTVDIQKTFFETSLTISEDKTNFTTEPVGILPGDSMSNVGAKNTTPPPVGPTNSNPGTTQSNPQNQNAQLNTGTTQSQLNTGTTQSNPGDTKTDTDTKVPGQTDKTNANGTTQSSADQTRLENGEKK